MKVALRTMLDSARLWKRETLQTWEFKKRRSIAETFVLSYPKSGRTWHRVMVGFYLARMTGENESDAIDIQKLCRLAGLPRVKYSHNGTNVSPYLPAESRCVASPDLWRARRVLLLVRSPKAVLVSAFHHARYRRQNFDGTLAEFIRDSRRGVDKFAMAHKRWHAHQHEASAFAVVSYEQMHANAADALDRTLRFIGVASPDAALVAEAVQFARFDNMKQQETTDFFNNTKMSRKGTDAPAQGNKVREGKTDSYRSHLSADDIAYIDNRMAELGGYPFAAECALPSLSP